jgi:hypothetical protein
MRFYLASGYGADFILLRITDTSDLRFINFRRLLPITALRRLKQLVFCLSARSLRRSGAPMMRWGRGKIMENECERRKEEMGSKE